MTKTEIKAAIAAEEKRHSEVMKELQSKLRVIEMEEAAQARDAYQERKELLEQTGDWIKDKLVVGDWVQVTGSRAGKYRRVAAINKWGIIGNVINQKRVRSPEGIRVVWSQDIGKVTEQGFNKITHIYRDGKFVAVKDLMEASVDITN